jgi:prepilin-type N-terminal cleavage/methylation domain-containing protein
MKRRIANKYGLTLVEVLVAVVIIAILAAGLYSVGNYLETQSKIKLTKSTIEILSAAIEQYHDFYGRFPNDPNHPSDPNLSMEQLYSQLSLAPDAKKILNQINFSAGKKYSLIKDTDKDGNPEIVDAWGTNLKYSYTSGDNFPLVTSAGPDGIWNDDDDITSRE